METQDLSAARPYVNVAELHAHASVPVFQFDLTPLGAQLQLARQALEELRVAHPQSTPSNVQSAYMSPWNSHVRNQKLVPLCDAVQVCAQYVAKAISGRTLADLDMNYFIANCWGAMYEGGNSALKHKHFPADLAAVCYLEADERSAPIVFGDGRVSIQPKSGMLIMFPGVLEHARRRR